MATMRFEMTYHAREERIDRLTACIQAIGFNEIIRERVEYTPQGMTIHKLTDTGLVLIVNAENRLITGYMGTIRQVGAFYYNETMPQSIKRMVRRNNERYAYLLKM